MSKPIYDSILNYCLTHPDRFHMPSHSGTNPDGLLYASSQFDVTELRWSDNLQNPTGIIAESERQCADSYNAKRSYYYTSGATTAIFTALAAVRDMGADIIVERASHKSVYSALRQFEYNPYFVAPDFLDGIPLPVTAEKLEAAALACPTAKVAVITSTNYFGQCADFAEITEVCREHDLLLIADEAHGAHFPFSDLLPDGFSAYADISVVSPHKTLSVYTGGAVLNCNNAALYDKIQALRADFHTTSPSYVTLASIDYAIDEMRQVGEVLYEKLYNRILSFKEALPQFKFLDGDDFTRLVILLGQDNLDYLEKLNINVEAEYGDWGVFILSPSNMDKLDALQAVMTNLNFVSRGEVKFPAYPTPVLGKKSRRFEFVPLAEAVGRTAYREAGLYPPGIPAVAYGEVITEEIAKILDYPSTFGFVNNKLCVTIE